MINYEWNCTTVDTYPKNGEYADLVYNVHYYVTGEDSETAYRSDLIGTQILDVSNVTTFKPFNELTNEDAVAWCKEAMGEVAVNEIEKTIASSIEDQINPASVTLIIGQDPVNP
jgi:hypothetical protein|tara:strand:+ start:512 stop:853 length:342 start_codon:yes stop_codon:yes gene_type:complete